MNTFLLNISITFLCLFTGFSSSLLAPSVQAEVPVSFGTKGIDYPKVELMPPVNVDSLLKDDEIRNAYKNQPYRFGYNHLVNFSTENSGMWTQLADGSRVWLLDVKSAGAISLNFAFSNFNLALGSRLYVYNVAREQVAGPYTSSNHSPDGFFATGLMRGDEVMVEYDVPAGTIEASTFNIFRVTHGYRDLEQVFRSYNSPFPCLNNVNCPQYAGLTNQKRAVVCIITAGGEICSGTLINNTLNDGTPYILTANHCGTADGTWVFRFNYESPYCETMDQPYDSLIGAVTVANSAISDFNLVRMNATPPSSFHPFYAGWNRSTTPATSASCIHHPGGDLKKCTRTINAATDTVIDLGPGAAESWSVVWTDGVTAAGSSGSALLDENHRIVGQLYGGNSACNLPDNQQNDFFGRFDISWDSGSTAQTRLRDWLDPDSSASITNDGFDPNPPADSLDLAILQIISPVGDSLCGDHVSPVIGLQNLGSSTIRFATISYNIDGGSDSLFTLPDSIVYLQPLEINLPPIYTGGTGSHTLNVQVSLPNGLNDQQPSNNILSSTFYQYSAIGNATPFIEGFEEDSFPANGWAIGVPPSGTTWQQAALGAYGYSQTSVMVNEFSPISSTAGELADLISPEVSLLNLTAPASLLFDIAYAGYDSIEYDSLQVLISADCGASWQIMYAKGGDSLSTAPDDSNQFIPENNQWRTDTVNLSPWIGQSAVQFDFRLISGFGNVLYLDNVRVGDSAQLTGIKNIGNNVQLKLFPNPFADAFTLQISLNDAGILNAGIYSVEGKLVQPVLNQVKAGAGVSRFVVNTNQLAQGLYFLKLNNMLIKLEKL